MTLREYLQTEADEFERAVIIVNFARRHPNADMLSPRYRKKLIDDYLDQEWRTDDGDSARN